MELEHLREYLTISEELNLSAAAKRVCTTQSTLSKHLASLEKEVGATLVKRSSRQMELTPAGVEFMNSARLICSVYDETLARIAELKARPNVTVSGMLQNRDVIAVVSTASRLLKERGEMNLSIVPAIVLPFLKNLLERKVDMTICYDTDGAEPVEGICRIPILQERFVACMLPACPLSSQSKIGIDDLRDVPLIRLVGDYSQNGWDTIVRVCAEHGFEPRYRTLPVTDTIDFIMADLGDAVLILEQDVLTTQQAALSGFHEAPIVDDDAYFTVCLYYREEDEEELSDYIEALCSAAERVQESVGALGRADGWLRLENGCRSVAERVGLNESEATAFREFAMGHSLERIGQQLGVSRVIVGDLMVSVYRKLGVRSRQEMLDLIESAG